MTQSAFISGASSGIGLALAEMLSDQGVAVTGVARDFSKTSQPAFQTIELDLSDLDQLAHALSQFKHAPQLLVLNAGYGKFGGIEQFSHLQIRHLIDTNLVSHLFLLKHFLPMMKRSGGGDIVIIGSESALQGGRSGAVYCASKFALRGLAQSLRADCANADIRVIMVNPGPVDSEFFSELDFAPATGREFSIEPASIARAISDALAQPREVVCEEINLQPMKRVFSKKPKA